MKKIYILITLCALSTLAFGQQKKDSTYKKSGADTIRIGNILIIKKGKSSINKMDSTFSKSEEISIKRNKRRSNTNWIIIDAGFANWSDNTTFPNTGGYAVSRSINAPFGNQDLKLNASKSANFNLWIFMQKIPLYKNNINLKTGLGLEWYNYSLRNATSFRQNNVFFPGLQPNVGKPLVYNDSISFSKNKLNLKYVSVPLMINFAGTKVKGKSNLSASIGVSASYLIRQRNKQNSNERGRQKNQGEFDLEKFKLSYIGEVGLGKIRLYGSYTPKTIFERGLDVKPFSLGIRFSNW